MDMPEQTVPAQRAVDLVWTFFATVEACASFQENEHRLTPIHTQTLATNALHVRVVIIGESHYVVLTNVKTGVIRCVELLACVDPAKMGFVPDMIGRMRFGKFKHRLPGVVTSIGIAGGLLLNARSGFAAKCQLDPQFHSAMVNAHCQFPDPYPDREGPTLMQPETHVHVGVMAGGGGIQIASLHEYARQSGYYDGVLSRTTIHFEELLAAVRRYEEQ